MPTTLPGPLCDALDRLARDRDGASWELLARELRADIERVARRITGSSTLAEDAAQETLCRVRDEAHGFVFDPATGEDGARSWIMRVAASTALNALRRQRRAQRRDQQVSGEPVTSEPPSRRLEAAESAALLREAVAELPERYRRPLLMRYQRELGFDRIAAELRIPIDTARVRVHRALKRLRRRMSRSGAALGAVLLARGSNSPWTAAPPASIAIGGTAMTAPAALVLAAALSVAALPLVRSEEPAPPPTPAAAAAPAPAYRRIHGPVLAIAADHRLTIDNRENGAREEILFGAGMDPKAVPISLDGAPGKSLAEVAVGDVIDMSIDDSGQVEPQRMADGVTRMVAKQPAAPQKPGTRIGKILENTGDLITIRFDDGGTTRLPIAPERREQFAIWRAGDEVRSITDDAGQTRLEHEVGDGLPKNLPGTRWGTVERYQDGKLRMRFDDGRTMEVPVPPEQGAQLKPGMRLRWVPDPKAPG